jgi:hypothetical protein
MTHDARVPWDGVRRLDASSPRCPQAAHGARVKLLDHQLAMLLRCREIENAGAAPGPPLTVARPRHGPGIPDPASGIRRSHPPVGPRYGLLVDKPGAGKTYVALFMTIQDLEASRLLGRASPGPTLVVVPQHIVSQWAEAITIAANAPPSPARSTVDGHAHGHAPGASCHAGPHAAQGAVRWCIVGEYADVLALSEAGALAGFDIVLTSSLYFDALADTVLATAPSRVHRLILDEVDSWPTGLAHRRRVDASFVWLISATADGLIREDGALRVGPYSVEPGEIPHATCVCDPEFVDACIALPPVREHVVMCADSVLDECLRQHGALDPALVTRLNALDFPGFRLDARHAPVACMADAGRLALALALLPERGLAPGEEEEERDECKSRNGPKARHAGRTGTTRTRVRLTTALRGLVAGPAGVAGLTGLAGSTYLACDAFDLTCSSSEESESESEYETGDDASDESDGTETETEAESKAASRAPPEASDAKLARLERVLDAILAAHPADHRIVVASEHVGSLEAIRAPLEARGLHHVALGSGRAGPASPTGRALLDFHNGAATVLFLDASLFAAGLNLQAATDLVLLHRFRKPGATAQVIGRAQRLGRTGALNVWHLLHANEA